MNELITPIRGATGHGMMPAPRSEGANDKPYLMSVRKTADRFPESPRIALPFALP